MISGNVNARNEAIVQLIVRGPLGQTATVAAIIDTGFDGALSLPPSLVAYLQLSQRRIAKATLGDGSRISHAVHSAVVMWDGAAKSVPVAALDSTLLVGMSLLVGYRLTMQVFPGGQVTLLSLATSQ